MMERSDVVVVGGGFVGITAAVALADVGARVTVLEALDGPNPAFRGELIHPRGARALEALGLADDVVAAGGVRVRGFAAFGPPPSAASSPEGKPTTPRATLLPYPTASGRGLALDHALLVDALRRAAAARARIRIVRGARVREPVVEDGRAVGVRVEGGAEHRAALVVAADGRQSRMRKLLGIAAKVDLLSHSAALSIDENALVEEGYGHVFVDAPGPTLAYPCGHGRVRMCIDVPLEAAKGPERLKAYLRAHYLPALPTALRHAMAKALDEPGPLAGAANHAVTAEACAVRGAALVGDAGGCSHPITAAGMTNGLHDVTVLAASVARRGLTDDALLDYQRRRYRFIRTREAFTRALYDVLLGAAPGTRALRDGMFVYWGSSERSRAASMAVLCGDDDRLGTFAVEYLRVVATSAGLCVSSGLARRDLRVAGRGVGATLAAATDAMKVAVQKGQSSLALERSAALAGVGLAGQRAHAEAPRSVPSRMGAPTDATQPAATASHIVQRD